LITVFIVVVARAAQAAFDAGEFSGVWDGVWWGTTTVTTVGTATCTRRRSWGD
jgi:hypothetical protein